MQRGLVTAIIPVFNRSAMLVEAVGSVLRQTYRNFEVVIVDDGSTDETPAVARTLAAANPDRVRAMSQTNAGPGAARNLGLSVANGEFVQYLDSDDLLEPCKFEWQVAALDARGDAGVAYGLTKRVDMESGVLKTWARTGGEIGAIFPDFLIARGWDTNSPLWRRSVCNEIGPWGPFRSHEDWEHDLRAGMLGIRPVRVEGHVATVRDHAQARATGSGLSQEVVADVFRAHRSVWRRMQGGGFCDATYLRPFSRKLFWIARMCGERGLEAEANEALAMAEQMSEAFSVAADIRAFRMLTRCIGWERSVALGELLRSRGRGRERRRHG